MDRFFRYTLTILISLVALSQFVQVITRYIFEMPVMGLEEMALIPTIWLYILGSVNASREDTQIRANVLEVFLRSERSRALLQAFSDLISIVVSVWMSWWAWKYFQYALRVWKETPTIYIPTFTYESALFIGLVLMTLFTVWHLLRNVRYLLGLRRTPDNGPAFPETGEVHEFRILSGTDKESSHG